MQTGFEEIIENLGKEFLSKLEEYPEIKYNIHKNLNELEKISSKN